MAERPILFSGEMVRAILDGRKTVTRRIIKPQPKHVEDYVCEGPGLLQVWPSGRFHFAHDPYRKLPCPHGDVGDRLWVRETWATTEQAGVHSSDAHFVYRATDPAWGTEMDGWRWRPSIHMPRRACRLLLDILDVRVERLQAITEDDAAAEGVEVVNGHPEFGALIGCGPSHREGFAQLWRELNGSGDVGWDANPWVFRIEFQKAVSA